MSSSISSFSSSVPVSSILSSFHESISTVSSSSLLPPSRPFHFLSSTASLGDAVKLLSARRILSAPVFDTTHDVCLGACSLLTIARFLAKENAGRGGRPKVIESSEEVRLENFLEKETKALAQVTLAEVMKSENMRSSLATFYEENPLSQLIDYFQTRQVHRVALISKSCELKHPCSQSDVIAWLWKQFSEKKFIQLSELPIDQVIQRMDHSKTSNSPPAKAICVSESTTVVSALDTMSRQNISCLGVLNGTGQQIAEFSGDDLRGLSDLQYLSLPVFEYLQKFSSSALAPLFIKSSTSFSSFVESLHSRHLHRGWLVDDTLFPLRVLTLSDVMKFLASGVHVTEEAANAGKDVSKLWTAKIMDAGKAASDGKLDMGS